MTQDPRHMMDFKARLYEQFGIMGRALSSPRRMEILDLLCQGERGVDELAKETGLAASNVSQHLRILKEAHLVAFTRDGLHLRYHLADPAVGEYWRSFRRLALGRLAELRELLSEHHADNAEFEALGAEDLQRRLADGEVMLLDVRPEVEYRGGHLPGARSMPLDELPDRIAELPRDREIVAYCRGPFCIMADEAVRQLRKEGFQASRLNEGPPEWRERGEELEAG